MPPASPFGLGRLFVAFGAGAALAGTLAVAVVGRSAAPVAAPAAREWTGPTPSARPTPSERPTPSPSAARPAPSASPRPATQPPRVPGPPQGVPITGRVLLADGRPAVGVPVRIGPHFGAFELFATMATLGLACVALCGRDDTGVTDAAGRYVVRLPRQPEKPEYDLSTGTEGHGTLQLSFRYDGRARRLPDLRLWDADPRLESSPTRSRVRHRPLPPGHGEATTYRFRIDQRVADNRFARALHAADRTDESFDTRLIEDVPALLRVFAVARTADGMLRYDAEPVAVRGSHHPISRGRPCVLIGGRVRQAASPCFLTDGRLAHDGAAEPRPFGDWHEVDVDLRGVRDVRTVVVRGCVFECVVSVSTDGRTYRRIAGDDFAPDDPMVVEVGAPARYVRVRYGVIYRMREISVFAS